MNKMTNRVSATYHALMHEEMTRTPAGERQLFRDCRMRLMSALDSRGEQKGRNITARLTEAEDLLRLWRDA